MFIVSSHLTAKRKRSSGRSSSKCQGGGNDGRGSKEEEVGVDSFHFGFDLS